MEGDLLGKERELKDVVREEVDRGEVDKEDRERALSLIRLAFLNWERDRREVDDKALSVENVERERKEGETEKGVERVELVREGIEIEVETEGVDKKVGEPCLSLSSVNR
jgi:hypothetical protein